MHFNYWKFIEIFFSWQNRTHLLMVVENEIIVGYETTINDSTIAIFI
jgi:hypothetical protein